MGIITEQFQDQANNLPAVLAAYERRASKKLLTDQAARQDPSTAVPEPASWSLLLAGLAVVGTAGLRKRTTRLIARAI